MTAQVIAFPLDRVRRADDPRADHPSTRPPIQLPAASQPPAGDDHDDD